MKKVSFLAVLAMVMVCSLTFTGCEDEFEDFDNLSTSVVNPTVVTDTIINVDTVFVPQVDTLIIDSTTPGQTRLVLDKHLAYGQWSGTGATRTITATHELKTIIIPDGGAAYTADSVVFNETGTMSWNFQPVYTTSINGTHYADETGCPSLGATCTYSWVYNVPTAYAPYFEGDCEMWPTQIVGSGTTATVVTKHGNTSRTATYTVNVDIPTPDSTVSSRNATWRHLNDCGQWTGAGATRTITIHCWCVESTTWSTGAVTKDSVLVAGHGTMTWSFPSYTSSQDGSYSANANGCAALGATCNMTWTYDVANIQGRTYNHTANCSLVPDGIDVVGTTATVNTVHGNLNRTAPYTLTINTPTPMDTVNHFNGNVVYWCVTASYKNSAQSSSDVDWFLCVVTLESGQYKVYYSPLASTATGLSFTFKGTITSAEYANLVSASNFTAAAESGLRCGLAMAYHHNNNAILDITAVKYSANTNQVKYYYLTNIGVSAGFHSAHSAIGQTIGGVSSAEPVREGGIKTASGTFTFVYNGSVVK